MRSLRLLVTAAAAGLACTSPPEQAPALQSKGAVAVAPAAETCDVAGRPLTVTALGILFSPSADGAFLADPANLCRQRANETTVNLVLWATGAGAPATFAPGTYAVHQDAAGGVAAFQVHLDGACGPTLPNVLAQGGTLTLSSVTAGRVTGSIDVAFADGRTLTSPFDAAIVPAAVTACQMFGVQGGAPAAACGARTCSP
jgi:hypothetical protein